MFVIRVNVRPDIMGASELAELVAKAVRERVLQLAAKDTYGPLVSVQWEGKRDESTPSPVTKG